jgi:hypothetical protein
MLRRDRASGEDLCGFVGEKVGGVHCGETCDLEGCDENGAQAFDDEQHDVGFAFLENRREGI